MARIVVMDDLDDMRLLFEDLLGSWGHEVISFDDGAPALAEVDFSDVDLVVTDLKMPTPGQVGMCQVF
jgi:CheY-like chemotaxis protein